MYWEKEIRIRITTRRIMGVVLIASVAANLAIVGAVFGTAPTTSSPTPTPYVTSSSQVQNPTFSGTVPVTNEVFTSTSTIVSPSVTVTLTDIPTDLPTLAMCVLRSDWPIYYARPGDTLLSLARAVGSTFEELMLANCMSNSLLSPGQPLFLPRLPVRILTSTPSATSTSTPTNSLTPTETPTETPTDTPTVVEIGKSTYIPTNTPDQFYYQFVPNTEPPTMQVMN